MGSVSTLVKGFGWVLLATLGYAVAGWLLSWRDVSPLLVILPVGLGIVGGLIDRRLGGVFAPWLGATAAIFVYGQDKALWGDSFLWPGMLLSGSIAAAGAIAVGRGLAELVYRLLKS